MQELETLRLFIRETLRKIKKQQKVEFLKEANEELSLRKTIRKLLREKQDIAQHKSTGINVLGNLLDTIIPIIKTDYNLLRTDDAQRKSFKAHILRGIQNLLSTASVYFSADKKMSNSGQNPVVPGQSTTGEIKEQENETPSVNTSSPESDPRFIELNKDKKKEKPNPVDAFQTIENEDLTGRNLALETFKRIQKQILETYSLLSNDKDREMFYDYLITNTRLHFDKLEDELKATPEEPTTPEYEAEKAKKDAAVQGGVPATGGVAPPAPAAPVGAVPPESVAPETPPEAPSV